MIVSLQDVSVRHADATVLSDVSVEIKGQRTAIIGANGSGKSTLVRLINGLVTPDSGDVRVDGLSVQSHLASVRKRVGFVFQNPDIQFVFPTVAEDLSFGLNNLGYPPEIQQQKVDDILAYYKLTHLHQRAVHTLSGGEKQLLCIAAVLVMQPELVIFDEPTTLLDLANQRMINQTIIELAQAVIVVTHDLAFIDEFDQVIVMHQGRVGYQGDPDTALQFYLDAIGVAL